MPRRASNKQPPTSFESGETLAESFVAPEEEPDIAVYRPDREGIRKVLGDLEAEVMEYIWDNQAAHNDGVTVRDVYEAFRQERRIAYTTVMTTMARLARKHLLRARKIEAAYFYSPSLTKTEFIESFVSRILQNLLVSFAETTEAELTKLVDNSEKQKEQIAALRERVSKLRTGKEQAGQKG
ncbi:MAG TPA: BlaI/MecI/CopY family transcriptional regulator [Chloroflexia bacterium]|nr:BlaI/MecI/CopY family transcriptional regulator [Chloroflexia bacterium]